ncbi:TAXI family TRAP transporter solute-binding subunit [Chloroflexi bacterium TSY]|nr:TAXI family TRAP transporter solute-binding subunit [Chloroflexi bacterium TSY]
MNIRTSLFLILFVSSGVFGNWWLLTHNSTPENTFAAGPRQGEAFAMALAIAKVTQRYYPEIQIEVLETRGSDQNMELLEANLVQIATIQADTISLPSTRLIAPLYPDVFQLVVREDAEIQSIADLPGYKIALPPEGSGEYRSFTFLAEHYGLANAEFEAIPMSPNAADWALMDGAVDAVFCVRAPGHQSILEVIANSPTRLVTIGQASAMQLKQPAIEPGLIAAGSYRGLPPLPEMDLETVAVNRLLVVHASLDDSLVRMLTSILFERCRDLSTLTPLAGFILAPDQESGTFMPVHPGAQSFYDREKPSFLQLRSRRKRQRLERYHRDVLQLGDEIQRTESETDLNVKKDQLLEMIHDVLEDAADGRLTQEGFEFFTFAWEVANEITNDQERLLEESSHEYDDQYA